MFNEMQYKTSRLPLLTGLATVLLFGYVVIVAQAVQASPTPESPAATLKGVMEYALIVIGFTSTVIGIGWGLLNRKKYDKLKETIQDLEGVIEAKEKRIEEKALQYGEMDARHKLTIQRLEQASAILGGTNEAVVSQNLQMKAILKGLRLAGKWAGNEDDIFDLHRTEG